MVCEGKELIMNIMMILISMIITSVIFAQDFNELDILCDYDGDGEYDGRYTQ